MRRKRFAAVLAALGIIVLSVLGGTTSATAVPPLAPTIDTYPSFTMAADAIVSGDLWGTAANMPVVVEVYNVLDPSTVVCTETVPFLALIGGWGCTVPLVDGYNSFYAISYEDDGMPDEFSAQSNTIVIARGGVQPPTIDSPLSGSTVVDYTPVFSGTGPVLGSITVGGGPFPPVCTSPVDEFGNWSCESSSALPPDTYGGFYADATRGDMTAGGATGFVTVTIAPPEPSLSYSVGPASATAYATGEPGSGVSVELYTATPNGEAYEHAIVTGCPALIDTFPINHERAYGGASVSCAFTGLSPGIWNVYSGQVVDGIYSTFRNDYFRVPTTPTIAARLNADDSVTVYGTAQAGGVIHVQTPGGSTVCQTGVVGTSWSCTVTQSPGLHRYVAYSQDQGFVADTGAGEPADQSFQGASAYSAQARVTVPLPPAPLIVRVLNVVLPTEAAPGDQIVVEGTDASPGATADIELHSDPVHLGTTVVNADGTFSKLVTIPEDTEPGDHHIVIVLMPTDGTAPTQVEQPLTVTPLPVAPEPTAEPVPTVKTSTTEGTRAEPGAESALSAGFVSPADIISNPLVAATAGSLGLALVLLVLVPAEFFGESLANHYSTFAAFVGRRKRLSRATSAISHWVGTHRLISGIALVLMTSAVFSFVDPGFGFDLTSLRLLLSCAISILLVNFASAGITELVAERAWSVPTKLKVMPWGLVIAIVGVIASRVLNFSPGFLIGSIIGVGIIGAVGARLEARVILLWSAVVWALAVGAWALIGFVPVLPPSEPAAFFAALLTDSLVATSAAGLTALLVALLPIALFDGAELFAYSKLQWALAFGVAASTFCLIVVPSASNWMGLGDGLLGWLLLTLTFVGLSIIAYVFARRRSGTKRSRLLTVD